MEIKKGGIVILLALISIFCLNLVSAEKLDIEIGGAYVSGENIEFKIVLYDDADNKIEGIVNYHIEDDYSEIISQGVVNSGETINFRLPEDSLEGSWQISASYEDILINRLFSVGELEKAEIKLEGDQLVVTNIGNIVYNRPILIYIGEHYETALVPLDIGQTKKIKLTAPEGNYNIKVDDGVQEVVFEGISLTGNVVGLESVSKGGFFGRFPLVSLFLGIIGLMVFIFLMLEVKRKVLKKK
jgi:hypothetical protein